MEIADVACKRMCVAGVARKGGVAQKNVHKDLILYAVSLTTGTQSLTNWYCLCTVVR